MGMAPKGIEGRIWYTTLDTIIDESGTAYRVPDLGSGEEKARKNDNFFAGMQKITTFACLFGEMP